MWLIDCLVPISQLLCYFWQILFLGGESGTLTFDRKTNNPSHLRLEKSAPAMCGIRNHKLSVDKTSNTVLRIVNPFDHIGPSVIMWDKSMTNKVYLNITKTNLYLFLNNCNCPIILYYELKIFFFPLIFKLICNVCYWNITVLSYLSFVLISKVVHIWYII